MSKRDIDFLEKGIRFKRKPAKMGKRYVFNIPNIYIENGLIDPNETYVIYLAKTEEDEIF
ncbi:MAG: hypothetical protein ACFE9S_15645 [Candidatus Hermodarchaeota archaeon]